MSNLKQYMTQRDKFFHDNDNSNQYVIFGDINNPMGDYSDYCLIEVIDMINKKSFIVTRSYIINEIQRLDPEI